MVLTYIAISAAVVMALAAVFLYTQYIKYRNEVAGRKALLEDTGVIIDIAPDKIESVRESVLQCVETQKEIMEMTYYSCDNFQKYQGKMAEKIEELYTKGSLQKLCGNIVYLANLAENGAMFSLAREYGLSELELRTCCFIHMGFKWQQTCTADSLTENAYNVRCSRIRKKFSLSKEERIPVFLENYCKAFRSSPSVQ